MTYVEYVKYAVRDDYLLSTTFPGMCLEGGEQGVADLAEVSSAGGFTFRCGSGRSCLCHRVCLV
jgi:hypothetical protein